MRKNIKICVHIQVQQEIYMDYSKELYQNKDIRRSIAEILYQRQYNSGEKFGHSGGVIFKISRIMFYLMCLYSAFMTLIFVIACILYLTGDNPVSPEFRVSGAVSMSVYTAMLIAAIVLMRMRRHVLATVMGAVGGLMPLLVFKNLLHAYIMEYSGDHAIFGDAEVLDGVSAAGQNKNAFVFAVLFGIVLIVFGIFVQYRRKLPFFAPLIAAAGMAGLLVWQVSVPADFFGAGFDTVHLVALFVMPAVLLFLAFRIYNGNPPHQGVIYFVVVAVMLLICWDIFADPIAAIGFKNFYLRHGAAALLLFLSSLYIAVTSILDRRRVTKEIDLIAEKIYLEVSTEEEILTRETWDEAVEKYIKNLYKKK